MLILGTIYHRRPLWPTAVQSTWRNVYSSGSSGQITMGVWHYRAKFGIVDRKRSAVWMRWRDGALFGPAFFLGFNLRLIARVFGLDVFDGVATEEHR